MQNSKYLITLRPKIFSYFIINFLVVSFLLNPSAWAGKSSTIVSPPTELRCELLKGDWVKNIRDAKPEFSWELHSQDSLPQQVAYRIQVTDAGGSFDTPLWDSGKVSSEQSIFQPYEGSELKPNQHYKWRVKTWLSKNKRKAHESAWSEPQRFSMAKTLDNTASQDDLVTTAMPARTISRLPSGRYLIDFGKAAFGYLELQLDASKAGKITVHFGERGSSEGIMSELPEKSSVRYYRTPLEVNASLDVYRVHPPRDKRNTLPNKAIAIPGRFGRIAPFRYVEIEANDLDIKDIQANLIAVHYPFDAYASSFDSSDDILNAIWDLCKYSMKATSFAGIYVDGDRERIPYEADAYINQLSHYLVDDEYSLARYSHEYLLEHPTWPTEWKQHSIMMAWADWMYTGDTDSISLNFDLLKKEKTLEHLARESDGLLESFPNQKTRAPQLRDLVDWPPSERDNFDFKKVNSVVNAFYYLNLKQMSQMAEAIGRVDEAEHYKNLASHVYNSYNKVLFNKKTGLYIDGEGSDHSSFHANVLPLAFGLVPTEHKDNIVAFLKTKGMAGSVYMAQYLMEALYHAGEDDYALSLLISKEKRSWYNMIRVGSTITLEAWDDEFKPNQDWNHAWGAVPGNIVGRYVLGVKPLKAGFSQVEIAPQPSTLKLVEGTVPTIRGPIYVSIDQNLEDTFTLKMSIPGNTTGFVKLPIYSNKKISSVRVNGKKSGYEIEDKQIVLASLDSGQYEIVLTYK